MRIKFWILILAATFSTNTFAVSFFYEAEGKQTQTIDGITIKLEKGGNASNAPAYSSYNGMKLYANNTITIDAEQAFKNVQLVFSKNEGKDYLSMSSSSGNLVDGGTSTALDDKKIDVWTGETIHLVFTMGTKGQRVLFQIEVDGEPIELNPISYVDDTPLETEYTYSEPTAIITPDENFYKKEYAFIENNIRVSCSKGSILNNDTALYFNCNAGETLTFEASQPIKGIVINGAVRKLFEATANKGTLTYLIPDEFYPEDYQECEHALIINDIDATSVTISCIKQLRCYSVYVYFDANPTATIDCDEQQGGGETFFLTFDSADAVYESEIAEEEGKTNYTIYLYDAATEFPYITLDLYPAAQGDLVGLYDYEEGSLGEYSWYQETEDALTRTWIAEGAVAVSKEGETYTVSGYMTCDDNNTYNFTFTGTMPFYTDDEYYAEGIEDACLEQQAQKILRDGQLFIIRGNREYNMLGF